MDPGAERDLRVGRADDVQLLHAVHMEQKGTRDPEDNCVKKIWTAFCWKRPPWG